MRLVHERLHLHQHGASAFARDHDDATRDRGFMSRQENGRRIADFPQAPFFHGEHPDLVGRTETILDRANHPETATGVALEVQHGIHHVLENARTRDGAFFRHMANHEHGRPRRLGEVDQHGRTFAQLRDGTGTAVHGFGHHGLDGVHYQHAGATLCGGRDDLFDPGFGQ